MLRITLFITLLLLPLLPAGAGSARIAVASNFAPAIRELAQQYERDHGHRLQLAFGSSGKHYAQIVHGAPFDAFFSADVRRARLLEKEGHAIPGSRFTYAIGQLVLWSADPDLIPATAQADRILDSSRFRRLAMANPRLAPYGLAAQKFLRASGREQRLRPRLIFGENISQAYQFTASGNAELGFVARSQLQRPGRTITGSWWPVPEQSHPPIEQQALLLRDNAVARDFLRFVQSAGGRRIIHAFGYRLPAENAAE